MPICHFTGITLFAIVCELEKRETIHYPTFLANVNNFTQTVLLWAMTVAVSGV